MAATFREYADFMFKTYVRKQLETVQRVDAVCVLYCGDSFKSTAGERRGTGTRRRVASCSKLPKNWKSFLHVSDNKTELFLSLAKELQAIDIEGKEVYTTYGEFVLSSQPAEVMECAHKETDTQLMLHAYHASQSGYHKILIRTVDTDVVVLAVSRLQDLNVNEIWIAFCTDKHYRYLAMHSIAEQLGTQRSKALLMFHSITGCDTVSFFSGRSKKSSWDLWNAFPQITDTNVVSSSRRECSIPGWAHLGECPCSKTDTTKPFWLGLVKKMKTRGNRCGHCYLKHNRYVTNSFIVAGMHKNLQMSERVWYAQLPATAAGHATRIPNSNGMDHR